MPPSLVPGALLSGALSLLVTIPTGCGGEEAEAPTALDAGGMPRDASAPTGDAGAGPPDAVAFACVVSALDPPVPCVVGEDAPCRASCSDAYCYAYTALPDPVCTRGCSSPADCPAGWRCNAMGRCRPP